MPKISKTRFCRKFFWTDIHEIYPNDIFNSKNCKIISNMIYINILK